jgi:hypothetical protein
VVPLLPIPNRTVKRLSADDSADSRVKVGHRQAITAGEGPAEMPGLLLLDLRFDCRTPSQRVAERSGWTTA